MARGGRGISLLLRHSTGESEGWRGPNRGEREVGIECGSDGTDLSLRSGGSLFRNKEGVWFEVREGVQPIVEDVFGSKCRSRTSPVKAHK